MKPVIGITCNITEDDSVGIREHIGVKGQSWQLIAENYIDVIERAGGLPVLIPFCHDFETVRSILDRVDGILISGGNDVDPQLYGARIHAFNGAVIPRRDRQDLLLTRYILEKTSKPVLGICRGIQIMNVATGGTLWQDVAAEGGFDHHSMGYYPMNFPTHAVSLEEGSWLREIFHAENIRVNSFHHQAVRELGNHWKKTAVSDDGLTEGIEWDDMDRFALAVQWHPEMLFDDDQQQRLIRSFVGACSKSL